MEWLDLLAPSAAVLALFIAVGLVVQSIRHGRAIKRLEQGLAQSGGAAVEASLERIQQLQARANISSGEIGPPSALLRRAGMIVAAVVALLIVGGLTWAFFLRGGDGDDALAGSGGQTISTPAGPPAVPPDQSTVPDDLPPLENKSLYDVAVLNATEVPGLAGDVIGPRVQNEGYSLAFVGDAPEKPLVTSVVMYAEGQKRVGQNVADDLGIGEATPLDGISDEQVNGADAVVLAGEDLAGAAVEDSGP